MATPVRRRDANEMAVVDPLAELNQLTNQLQSFFEGGAELPSLIGEGFVPLADIEETEDSYVVELELPGVRREDVSVEMSGRRLVVTGERKERERTGILRRRARTVGRFHFEVVLPGDVAEEGVEAHLDGGVLTLRVPKADTERRRRIEIQ
jgi:HSP20 family protein